MAEMTQPIRSNNTGAQRASTHWAFWIPPVLVALIIVAATLLVLAFELSYANRIYPGITVWQTDLSGLTYEQAVGLVEQSFPYTSQPALTLRDGEQVWQVRPSEVGARLDADKVVSRAFNLGRTGNLAERLQSQAELWRNGYNLSPIVVFNPAAARAYLGNLAVTVNQPAQDAGIRLEGTTVITTPAVTGRKLDPEPVIIAMQDTIHAMQSAEIVLPVHPVQPSLAEVTLPAREVQQLLSHPIELVELGPNGETLRTWPIEPAALAQMVSLRRVQDQIQVKLDENQLRAIVDPLAPDVALPAVDGRYIFDDETQKLAPLVSSVDGRELDSQAMVGQIMQQAFTDNRRVPLVFRPIKAKYYDGLAPQDIGITGLVAEGITYFKGSSAARIKNIKVAASKFHGVILAPGETFSFNYYLGDVSLNEGYEEGLIIYEGRTIKGVGGGVCQVSTTVMRAAFQAGFPIVERWPHAYRVSWYEKGFGPGLDATVFAPLVDFKFTNDTPYHLLIETYTNETEGRLTFKFYSSSDGRQVTIGTPEVYNVVAHGPDIYEDDPSLPAGSVQQVDWAVDGADVIVRRTVERDGVILHEDQVYTHYLPWQAIFKVGPKLPEEPPAPTP